MNQSKIQALKVVSNHETNQYLNQKIEEDKIDKRIDKDMSELCGHLYEIRDLVKEGAGWDNKPYPLTQTKSEYMEYCLERKLGFEELERTKKNIEKRWEECQEFIKDNKTFLDNVELNEYNIGFITGLIMGESIRDRLKEVYTTPILKPDEKGREGQYEEIDYFTTSEQQSEEILNTKNYILKAQYHDSHPFDNCDPGWFFSDGNNYPSHSFIYQV